MHSTININDRIAQAKEEGRKEGVKDFYHFARKVGLGEAYQDFCRGIAKEEHMAFMAKLRGIPPHSTYQHRS